MVGALLRLTMTFGLVAPRCSLTLVIPTVLAVVPSMEAVTQTTPGLMITQRWGYLMGTQIGLSQLTVMRTSMQFSTKSRFDIGPWCNA